MCVAAASTAVVAGWPNSECLFRCLTVPLFMYFSFSSAEAAAARQRQEDERKQIERQERQHINKMKLDIHKQAKVCMYVVLCHSQC